MEKLQEEILDYSDPHWRTNRGMRDATLVPHQIGQTISRTWAQQLRSAEGSSLHFRRNFAGIDGQNLGASDGVLLFISTHIIETPNATHMIARCLMDD
jgi:hypothetical protein